ncbi:MAG TPA: hypothetical protein VJ945_02675 [Flavobacteriaceae bacterium]|nr:hypothetical protein [Flavobacteriaceae bacterium]
MKSKLFILSIFALTFVVGCFSDHNDTNYGIEGQWNLTHVSGGLSGMDMSYDPGVIIWTFDENTGMVTIVNNSEDGFSSFQSGTYPFQIDDQGDHMGITIDGLSFGSIEISQNQLNIDQRVADGVLLELTK